MKAFSFNNVIMLVQGSEITGWPEGDDVILCERLEDSGSHSIGVQGEMTFNVSNDRSGTVKFKLKQNSSSNLLMTGLVTAQENGAFLPVFVQVKNTEGGELISGTQGYVLRPASMQFGKELGINEWTVVVERLDMINLGTDSQPIGAPAS